MIDYWKELQFEILVKVDFMIALRPLLMKLLTNNAKFNFFIAEGLASLGTSSSLWYLSSLESDSQRPKFRSATDPHRPISRLSLFFTQCYRMLLQNSTIWFLLSPLLATCACYLCIQCSRSTLESWEQRSSNLWVSYHRLHSSA